MFDFTTKDEYLAQRAAWTQDYKALSAKIREFKAGRKEFTWEYRAKGDTTSQRKTKVGDNPKYSPCPDWQLNSLRFKAREMMVQLTEAKEEAGRQRAASKEVELA